MVTSGPGATNLVTPLCDAYMDSVPMVAITGQVARAVIGTDSFQEADTVGITRSVTKHNELVMRAEDIALAVRQAFLLATTGRPGPVLLDIPKDILQATTEWYWPNDDEVSASLPGLQAQHQRPSPHGARGGAADNRLAAARDLCRRRDPEGPGLPRPCANWPSSPMRPWSPRSWPGARFPTATRSAWACRACTAITPPSRPCRRRTC